MGTMPDLPMGAQHPIIIKFSGWDGKRMDEHERASLEITTLDYQQQGRRQYRLSFPLIFNGHIVQWVAGGSLETWNGEQWVQERVLDRGVTQEWAQVISVGRPARGM